MMEFGVMTEPQLGGNYEEILAAASWAESAGLTAFARSDHYYSSRTPSPDATDAFATLAGLARETESIRLCVLVSPITFRHPGVIAKTAATLDQMSGGRFDLGLGTGWMDLEHEAFGLPFPEWSERFEHLEEALPYIRAAFTGGGFDGRHYALQGDIRPRPSGIRLIVGGSGARRTPALAGTHADEYNHFIDRADVIRPKIETMRDAAEAAGRDPDAITVSVMGRLFIGRDEAEYREVLAAAASIRDLDPDEFETRLEDNGVPHGTSDEMTGVLAELDAIGVRRLYFQWLDLTDLEGMKATWEALKAAAM